MKIELASEHKIARLPWRTVCVIFESGAASWRTFDGENQAQGQITPFPEQTLKRQRLSLVQPANRLSGTYEN